MAKKRKAPQEKSKLKQKDQKLGPPKLGIGNYRNNNTFSDVTIHYGKSGDRKFFGHKIILASKSHWFRAAFTNDAFNESESRELFLHGDDASALEIMLEYIYTDESVHTDMSACGDCALQNIAVHEVADKYDVPGLIAITQSHFGENIESSFIWLDDNEDPNCEDERELFIDIVKCVYEVTGARLQSVLRNKFITSVFDNGAFGLLGKCGRFVDWLAVASEAVQEFGRDMVAELVKRKKSHP